jgi:hypothetical protein
MKAVTRAVLCVGVGAVAALAQSVISARSGMIHYVEGQVFLGDQAVQSKFGSFPEVKENGTLRTQTGRAEVLLTPGVFLRLGENSSFRMVTNRLIDTRLEFISGSAVIEADELPKDNSVTVVYKDTAIRLAKKGLYRFDGSPAALHVFDGEADVKAGDRTIEVKDGKMVTLDSDLAMAKFNKNATDPLDRWSRRRGEYLAMANVSAANSIRRSGSSWMASGWRWNPYFGMFTFIPMSGVAYSPYGYRFWSPVAVGRVYERPVVSSGGFGGMGASRGCSAMGQTSSGYSGVVASAPAASSAPSHAPSSSAAAASSAPVSRGGGSAGGAHK